MSKILGNISQEKPWRGMLNGVLIALFTAVLAVLIVYPLAGGVNESGLTGAVAGISAANLLSQTIKKLKKHALKAYFGLVFFNTFTTALAVYRFRLHPEGTATFLAMFLAVYVPLALIDYGGIRILEGRYRLKDP